MKKLIASIFFVSTILLTAQEGSNYTIQGTPADIVVDAKNISMGESFVAYGNSINSFFENPAAVSDNNLTFFYNYRYHGWNSMLEDMNYFNAGASVSASFGKFAFSYNKFSSGDISINNDNNSYKFTYTLFSIILAKDLFNNFTVGFGIKFFNSKSTSNSIEFGNTNSNTPTLIDFGVLYAINKLVNSPSYTDKLSFGISVQNFSDELKETNSLYPNIEMINELAKYARIGFAYETKMILGEKTHTNVDITITGEYYRLLNPGAGEEANVDYWGAGTELKFFNIIALRTGVVVPPTQSVLYERGKLNWRYGAGLNYPFNVWGLPLSIYFDYAYIPIRSDDAEIIYFNNSSSKVRSNFYAFSFSIGYNGRFF
ncbi:MAG: hypothetical protein AB1633_09145 [Elusimicrobiota bacterium]